MADPASRAGLRYSTPAILEWVDRVHAGHDEGLQEAFESPGRNGMPAIQVGPSEGRAIELLVRLCGARRALEIGTLAGYSAIRIARALPADGRLFTIEADPRHAEVATRNLARAGFGERVSVRVGPAREVLPSLEAEAPFDAVFLDADKGSYDHYGRWAARHLRKGGLLLADNVFLFGRLLDEGPEAEAMRRFHEEARDAFETVCLPTPDGLLLGLRS